MDCTVKPGRTYRYYTGEPLYPFGFGLSYTDFDIQEVNWPKNPSLMTDGSNTLNFTLSIENIGDYDGDEVIMAYYKPSESVGSPLLS